MWSSLFILNYTRRMREKGYISTMFYKQVLNYLGLYFSGGCNGCKNRCDELAIEDLRVERTVVGWNLCLDWSLCSLITMLNRVLVKPKWWAKTKSTGWLITSLMRSAITKIIIPLKWFRWFSNSTVETELTDRLIMVLRLRNEF